ncbi:MAG: FAD-dependent oxidoreductase [Deinococcales bacterium]
MMQANVVIIGSGIVGSSAAYHLSKLGWKDILVLDKGDLIENDGSTSHAPGGVVALSHSKLLTEMAIYSRDLFASLKPYSPNRMMLADVGGLEVAGSDERWQDLIRLHGSSKAYKAESYLLSPEETVQKLPYLNPKAMKGSLYVRKGANIAGSHVTAALQRDATEMSGARFIGHTQVTDLILDKGRIKGLKTSNPELSEVACEYVVICSNIWAPALSERYGVHLPLVAFEHQYVVTEDIPELSYIDTSKPEQEVMFPNARDLDAAMYYRQHWNRYGIGNYQHAPHMVKAKQVKKSAMHPFTPEDMIKAWEQAQHIMPILKGQKFTRSFNGMFAFSVDGMPIIGESHIKGLWSAVASWITHSGGVGKSLAEWMTYGEAEWDMRSCHIHRFNGYATTDRYITDVCMKNYREIYDIVHPKDPPSQPRNVRLSPFKPRLDALGAVYTVFAGLELPNYFQSNEQIFPHYETKIPARSGWSAKHWSPIQGAEHLATREQVALFDLTGLSIIQHQNDALNYVNQLCTNQMDKAVGSVIYTRWLTPKGGVKRDLAVARLAEDCFWLFVGEGTRPQDLDWVKRNVPEAQLQVQDLSDGYGALGLWGPKARRFKVSPQDVSNEAFPYFTCQWIEVGQHKRPLPCAFLCRRAWLGNSYADGSGAQCLGYLVAGGTT